MRLVGFRVQMYKGIIDSGWVKIDALNVLVGKNESGKTSLLRALHKLNPFSPEPYDINREWPRGKRKERNTEQVVCTAQFALSTDEQQYLANVTPYKAIPQIVEVSRNYADQLVVHLHEELFPSQLHPDEVAKIISHLPRPSSEAGKVYQSRAEFLTKEVAIMVQQGDAEAILAIASQHEHILEEALTADAASPQQQYENQHLAQYNHHLAELADLVRAAITIRHRASIYIAAELPTFIYMDDYRTFTGSAELDQVYERRQRNVETSEDKTLITIMELAGLDLAAEVDKGAASSIDREQRQYDFDDASASLTKQISDRWKQRRYEVQLRADGQHFYTFVKDERDVSLIRLEERSRGFQWFFSFDLMLMYETKGTFEDAVILLDEPGLHLHPEAQRDLLKRLEAYAENNTLIYSTHLPFMIDLKYPQRIRTLAESQEGIVVTDDLTMTQPEAKLVLQYALGMSGAMHWLVSKNNLVVEGVDDYWFISELSRLLVRSGESGLPEDLMITPAGGASEAAYMATFMIGQQLNVVALFDSDAAGKNAQEHLLKNWLTRYHNAKAETLTIGECIDIAGRDCMIEDLFEESFYLTKVQETYAKQLSKKLVLAKGSDPLLKRVTRTIEGHGITFNKGSVAKRIRTSLTQMKDIADLPPETAEKARKLIAAINKAIPS